MQICGRKTKMLRDLTMIVLDFAGDLSIKRYQHDLCIRTELAALRIIAGLIPVRLTPSFARLIIFFGKRVSEGVGLRLLLPAATV
jgi:hypothetical protein